MFVHLSFTYHRLELQYFRLTACFFLKSDYFTIQLIYHSINRFADIIIIPTALHFAKSAVCYIGC